MENLFRKAGKEEIYEIIWLERVYGLVMEKNGILICQHDGSVSMVEDR